MALHTGEVQVVRFGPLAVILVPGYKGHSEKERVEILNYKFKKIELRGKNLNFSLPVEVAGHNLLFLNKLHDMLPNIFMDNFTGFQLINIFL